MFYIKVNVVIGSLCAMLAFACPLQNLTYMLAASHLFGNIFRAFYLLYFPFRPKYIPQISKFTSEINSFLRTIVSFEDDSSLAYSRLDHSLSISHTMTSSSRRSLWNINLPKSSKKSKSKRNDVDKEWLLLGEPSSPCPLQKEKRIAESSVLSDGDQVVSLSEIF